MKTKIKSRIAIMAAITAFMAAWVLLAWLYGIHDRAADVNPSPISGVAEAGEADALSIEHMDDLWVVSGKWMQQLIADINFADYESRMYFDRQLRKSGLFDRLEEMGIEDGDTVSIYDFEFEYER